MFNKRHIAMVVAEFVGTFTLASAVLAMAGRTSFPFFASIAAGLTLGTMVLVIGRVSGSHINPAVTFGLWTLRKVSSSKAVAFIATQMLAGLVALRLNEYLLDHALPALAEGAAWDWRVVIAEGLGTLIFTFGIAAAVYSKYEGGRLATAIGASLSIGVLIASFAANGALNPAVALGINSWNVSYVVAPLVGAVLGMNLYALVLAPVDGKGPIARRVKGKR